MKPDATKKSRVAENESAFRLSQHEVIVLFRTKVGWFHPERARHSEVNTEPVPSRELEQHLFSPRLRAEKARARQVMTECARIRSAKDALPRVELHAQDFLTQTAVPLPAKIFHFGQFGHQGKCCSRLALSRRWVARRSRHRGTAATAPGCAVCYVLPMEKVIIVGSGCAGLTAAIYAARANLNPLVLEGRQPGGQLSTTTMVENFPGFPQGIDGPQLIINMHEQAEKFGARFAYSEVTDFEGHADHVRIKADDEWLETRALIVASGASARWLGLENEEKLVGHGLTSCATCDGAFYRNVPVCVIGGGDSAAEEALFVTRFASKVYLIHRRDALRASKIMADRVLACEQIEPIWNTVVTRYVPDEKGEMSAVMLRNVVTHEERELPVACVFVAIGHDPNTKAFKGKLETDPDGYLLVRHLAESKHPGVFIAGDVADRVYKQAVTAAGSGCAAALEAEKYLSALGK